MPMLVYLCACFLHSRRVTSLRALVSQWAVQPHYLLREVMAWLPRTHQDQFATRMWPQLVSDAQEAVRSCQQQQQVQQQRRQQKEARRKREEKEVGQGEKREEVQGQGLPSGQQQHFQQPQGQQRKLKRQLRQQPEQLQQQQGVRKGKKHKKAGGGKANGD